MGRAPNQDARPFQLGERRVDPAAGEIDGHHIGPTPMAVLVCLAEHAPQVASSQTLLDTVWPNVVVGENVLHQAIRQLRRTLGDGKREHIETVPRRGYRLRTIIAYENPESPPTTTVEVSPLSVIVEPVTVVGSIAFESEAALITAKISREIAATALKLIVPTSETHRAAYRLRGAVNVRSRRKCMLSLQLIRVGDGKVVWTHDRAIDPSKTDLPCAAFVARALETHLRFRNGAGQPEAHEEARRGLIEWGKFTLNEGGNLKKAIRHLERATSIDRESVLAHRMLAIVYSTKRLWSMHAKDAIPLAHHYARRLLDIDPHDTYPLGHINRGLDLDYDAAIRNVEHARLSDLNSARGRYSDGMIEQQIGLTHYCAGRLEAAIDSMRCAVVFNALDDQTFLHMNLANALADAGQLARARTEIERGLSLMKHPWVTMALVKARICLLAGDRAEGERAVDSVWPMCREHKAHRHAFSQWIAELGAPAKAREILAESEKLWCGGKLFIAETSFFGHLALGEVDAAFTWLGRAIENREHMLIGALRSRPELDVIRGDPRFAEAMARIEAIEARGSPTQSLATRSDYERPARHANGEWLG